MNTTTDQVRSALDAMAEAGTAPDPRTLLTGASREVGRLRRRRQAGWLGAAAAAVVAIAGGSVLLTELTGDTQGEVAPAEPDESYTEGYGIVDGQIQPHLEGLRLIGTQKVAPTDERLVSVPDAAADTQLYAVAWCDPAESGLQEPPPVQLAADRFTAEMPCLDRSTDLNSAVLLQPLPPDGMDYTLYVHEGLNAVLGFYVEEQWRDYPFPVTAPTPFSATEGIVIDGNTPESADSSLDAVPSGAPVHSVTVPITDDLMALTMQVDQPGQLLVALDGVVLTNDAEDLDDPQTSRSEPWNIADSSVREGYLLSFGPPVERSLSLNAQILAEEGVDVSDGEVTVSVHARGFVDDSAWRVVIGGTDGGEVGSPAPLEPATDTDVAEYAYGHRLVAAYEVPTDAVAHPVGIDPRQAAELTWVAQCPETAGSDAPTTGPDIGTATVAGASGPLRCLGEDGWLWALTPPDRVPTGTGDGATTLALRPLQGIESRIVAAYEPVLFEDFPFAESDTSFAAEPGAQEGSGSAPGGAPLGSQNQETARVTLADLDADGRATIEVADSELTQLSVSTEGVGRFWLEPEDPAAGPMPSTGPAADTFGRILGRDGYWTSWTDQPTIWPISPVTDSGRGVDRLTVRVEGYEQGSFSLRVFRQVPEGEQP